MNDQLTFGDHPIHMELINDEVLITCKGITGTLTQGHDFLNRKKNTRCFFGESKIRSYPNQIVKIDCLEDTLSQFILIYEQALLLKNGNI